MSFEDYIKDLSPELQEKARACGSMEELLALAKEEKVPLHDEALAAIAGGDDVDSGACDGPEKCPKCGHKQKPYRNEDIGGGYVCSHYKCDVCGYKWYYDWPAPH